LGKLWPVFLAPVLWIAISAFFSYFSGWMDLAKQYSGKGLKGGRFFSFQSAYVGSVSYRSCVFVRLTSAGIAVSVFPLHRLFTPPLMIPWTAISRCERKKTLFFQDATTIWVAKTQNRLAFTGKVGVAIYNEWLEKETGLVNPYRC
jgi:hypothetical protein